jgi:2-polyprenyl-3-methyl-5-hydroxy-6-metoxy-1,4-benzoquinol methylase
MAEVLEHVHTAPSLVLRFVASLLRPGGLLVLQTPNAVALGKRVGVLLGRNPYHLIREDPGVPGHFREYTRAELCRYLDGAGFAVEACHRRSYFDLRHHRALRPGERARWPWYVKELLYRIAPPALRTGITVVARRPPPRAAGRAPRP